MDGEAKREYAPQLVSFLRKYSSLISDWQINDLKSYSDEDMMMMSLLFKKYSSLLKQIVLHNENVTSLGILGCTPLKHAKHAAQRLVDESKTFAQYKIRATKRTLKPSEKEAKKMKIDPLQKHLFSSRAASSYTELKSSPMMLKHGKSKSASSYSSFLHSVKEEKPAVIVSAATTLMQTPKRKKKVNGFTTPQRLAMKSADGSKLSDMMKNWDEAKGIALKIFRNTILPFADRIEALQLLVDNFRPVEEVIRDGKEMADVDTSGIASTRYDYVLLERFVLRGGLRHLIVCFENHYHCNAEEFERRHKDRQISLSLYKDSCLCSEF